MLSIKNKRFNIPLFMVLPTIIFILAVSVYPLIYSFYMTLHDWSLTRAEPPTFVGIGNYISLFQDNRFWYSFRTTVIFTGWVVGMEMVIGMALALSITRNTRFQQICRSILLIPMMITPVVLSLMWKYMYNPEYGIFNYFLHFLKIEGPIWLGEPAPALPAVIMVDIWQWTPFIFLLLFSGIASLPPEVFEAAQVDGASGFQTFRNITLPLSIPFLLVALLIRFMDSFRIFDTIYVLTKGGPANATETLSIYTYKVGFNYFNMGYAATLSYIILVIISFTSQQFVKLERKS
ncbi:MAG: sugar ABC transporter permease [Candidatus Atribacteria bacterium]|nr:sugar ABC transporter permease [Candidatus Atribacteria bacterium]